MYYLVHKSKQRTTLFYGRLNKPCCSRWPYCENENAYRNQSWCERSLVQE